MYRPGGCAFKTLDLLLMLWPIFFVYAVPREPEYKARNFRESAKRASKYAVNLKTSVSFKPKEQRFPRRAPGAAHMDCEEDISLPGSIHSSTVSFTAHQVWWQS